MCVSTQQCLLEQEVRGGCSDEGKTSQVFMAVRAKKPRAAQLSPHDFALGCAPCWWWGSWGPAPCPHQQDPRRESTLFAAEAELCELSRPLLGAGIGLLSLSLATASCATKPAGQGMGSRRF